MAHLFEALRLRDVTLPNRIAVSPMCMYSAVDGVPNDWHLVHLGSRAVGGAGLVFTEATAVSRDGRISPEDTGIWNDAQAGAWARIAKFIEANGSFAGIQLAHAGRKASVAAPQDGGQPVAPSQRGWIPVAPSPLPFADGYPVPHELSEAEIARLIADWRAAAQRSLDAGFHVIEIHAAHGYLLHEFLSPLGNQRTDRYGGSFDNRIRLLCEIVAAVRGVWPERLPLFVRVSAIDWVEGGWVIEDTVELAKRLHGLGVDLLDCSSGGNHPSAVVFAGAGYQSTFAERVRHGSGLASGAVGLITSAAQADHIIRTGQADLVLIARQFLRDPYFGVHAAQELGQTAAWATQYLRAAPAGSTPRPPAGTDAAAKAGR
jgi:2,4-dienoyl-CoA reductase-like NADH-dependent reductase (Old Yellow Enzyme family)